MRLTLRYVLLGCALAMIAGCSKESSAGGNAGVPAALAKADKADGTVDKVVHKCAGCALGMDGKKEHALALEGYELHFCSQGCLDKFKPDPAKNVLALKLPD